MHAINPQAKAIATVLSAVAVIIDFAFPGAAVALDFKAVVTSRQQKILLVYDCGNGVGTDGEHEQCEPYETHFSGPAATKSGKTYPGDAAVLDDILTRDHDFEQVWLASGGGEVEEGLKFGYVLRKHKQFAFVPPGVDCASSCTLAFLGGALRDVDPKAAFQVHAPSAYLEPEPALLRALGGRDGEFLLSKLVTEISDSARAETQALLVYIQTMIGGAPSSDAIMAILAQDPDFAEVYRQSGHLRIDARLARTEGPIWTHDLLMRLERDASAHYLDRLKAACPTHGKDPQPLLGARSAEALRIVDNMYRSRITGTFQLDQNTLREMGYTNVKH